MDQCSCSLRLSDVSFFLFEVMTAEPFWLAHKFIHPVRDRGGNVENRYWMGPPCAGPAESVYGIETGSPKAGPRQTGKEREVGG